MKKEYDAVFDPQGELIIPSISDIEDGGWGAWFGACNEVYPHDLEDFNRSEVVPQDLMDRGYKLHQIKIKKIK